MEHCFTHLFVFCVEKKNKRKSVERFFFSFHSSALVETIRFEGKTKKKRRKETETPSAISGRPLFPKRKKKENNEAQVKKKEITP